MKAKLLLLLSIICFISLNALAKDSEPDQFAPMYSPVPSFAQGESKWAYHQYEVMQWNEDKNNWDPVSKSNYEYYPDGYIKSIVRVSVTNPYPVTTYYWWDGRGNLAKSEIHGQYYVNSINTTEYFREDPFMPDFVTKIVSTHANGTETTRDEQHMRITRDADNKITSYYNFVQKYDEYGALTFTPYIYTTYSYDDQGIVRGIDMYNYQTNTVRYRALSLRNIQWHTYNGQFVAARTPERLFDFGLYQGDNRIESADCSCYLWPGDNKLYVTYENDDKDFRAYISSEDGDVPLNIKYTSGENGGYRYSNAYKRYKTLNKIDETTFSHSNPVVTYDVLDVLKDEHGNMIRQQQDFQELNMNQESEYSVYMLAEYQWTYAPEYDELATEVLNYNTYTRGEEPKLYAKYMYSDFRNIALDSVSEIETEETQAKAEYFDLQGRCVENPSKGVFIRRQGSRVSKIIL